MQDLQIWKRFHFARSFKNMEDMQNVTVIEKNWKTIDSKDHEVKLRSKKNMYQHIRRFFRKVSPLHRANFIVISCALYEARRTKLQKPKALLLLLLTEFSDVVVPLVPCHHHSSRQSNTKPVQIWRQWTIRQKSNVFPALKPEQRSAMDFSSSSPYNSVFNWRCVICHCFSTALY